MSYKPGDMAHEYARRNGWTVKKRNLMVEGDSDVRYFELAGRLYKEKTGLNIIGADFSIFSAGTGDSGGTRGLFEEFPTFRKIIKNDCDPNGTVPFRVVALVDNDAAGRSCYQSLLQQYRWLRENRDIFILHHIFPRTTSEPKALTSQLAKHNAGWKGSDCEIEDLLDENFIACFLEDEPDALAKPKKVAGPHCHYEWRLEAKGKLFQFVKKHSMLEDLTSLVDVLKSFRFYLGLPVEGVQ